MTGYSLFSRIAERSELLIESEAHSAAFLEAQSAEPLADVAPKARAAQANANLDHGIYISAVCKNCEPLIYISIYICQVHCGKGSTKTFTSSQSMWINM